MGTDTFFRAATRMNQAIGRAKNGVCTHFSHTSQSQR